MYSTVPVVSVTQFNEYTNEVLANLKFGVRGEIIGYKVSQGKWVTFDLKDATSKISCFSTVYKQNVALEDGMEVICYGYPKIYVPYGRFSFTVEAVEPVGEGALKKAFELTKSRLESEGLFDPKYKKPLPRFPDRIGIVSSPEAAAYTDILRILNNRWGGLEIFLRPVLVQGVNAPGEIVEAIQYFNAHFPVDVILVARGGGSLEDLQAFNDERVCRAIFASKIPIITGVGHERDTTLVDYVADRRASTPSNAAEIAVPDRRDILDQLLWSRRTMDSSMEERIRTLGTQLLHSKTHLDRFVENIQVGFSNLQAKFVTASNRLGSMMQTGQSNIALAEKNIRDILLRRIALSRSRLGERQVFLQSTHPYRLLEKGYSISYQRDAKTIIRSAKSIKWGDKIVSRWRDGEAVSIVEKTTNPSPALPLTREGVAASPLSKGD
ncbi:MAG: Exodeoxyribonuclease 7 large subunit [Parcubacteria group bacterium Gr01-1014_18]|nr:MAG: Exodeoxyribonuclease 7 large subunit [Parcubacteria group bacterium Greene0416_36]TSC81120.1 MAG: Exodeoxyribonuclease 7 large subunit [Parcubacteria group bacterium Gr01-1014_18]TSC98463.1 MAG: Exodeoxyribonuclease 7 large subunit [Parcubacteria group bacterium Greene1014_20]TSD07371.1 MAG: Exodeoxyribonuclease 7 large subunit [Parcubacteria group bacterium Greene0714_2]